MSVTLNSLGKQIVLYTGIPVFIAGILGGVLNIITFVSLRTFRESSCAFYLTVMSLFNIIQLCTGLLTRILTSLSNGDGTEISLFYCKFRPWAFQVAIGGSLTCLCLATIDQYCATGSHIRWQQFCRIKIAYRLVVGTTIIWMLHGIVYLVYFVHAKSTSTNQTTCTIVDYNFTQYRIYVIVLTLLGILPVSIAVCFGLLAFRNIQQLTHRTRPIVRLELDKQLTVMVLAQVTMNVSTYFPYNTINSFATMTFIGSYPTIQRVLQFISTVAFVVYYIYFAVST